MKELCDIPNIEGFKFTGVKFNGDTAECVVIKKETKNYWYYSVRGINDETEFNDLIGWL